MKTKKIILFFISLASIAPNAVAQFGFTVVPVGSGQKTRKISSSFAALETGTKTSATFQKDDRVTVIGSTPGDYILKVNRQSDDQLDRRYAAHNRPRYFNVPKYILDENTQAKILSPVVGVLAYPFRYRPQTGKFEKAFTLNVVGGPDIRIGSPDSKNTIKILAGVGPSSITVRPDDVSSDAGITENKDLGAITCSINIIYSWSFLQIGLSSGFDHLFDNEKEHWYYQDRGWFSFGIGINLFTSNNPE